MDRKHNMPILVQVAGIRDLQKIDSLHPKRVVILEYGNNVLSGINDLRKIVHIRCTYYAEHWFSGYCNPDMSDELDVKVDRDILYITNTTDIPWSSILMALDVVGHVLYAIP